MFEVAFLSFTPSQNLCLLTLVISAQPWMGALCTQTVLLNFAILEIRKKRKEKLDHIYLSGRVQSHEALCIKLLEKHFI